MALPQKEPIKLNLQAILGKYTPKAHASSPGDYFKQFSSITGPLTHYDPQGYARSSDGKFWDFTHMSWAGRPQHEADIRMTGKPVEFKMNPGDETFFNFKPF